MSKSEIDDKMEKIIEFSELGHHIDEPLYAYSLGMKMRLGFSIAVESSPDILLIDEVLGVGDENFRGKSIDKIIAMTASDRTVVIVSHGLNFLLKTCNRGIVINSDMSIMEGSIEEAVTYYKKT